MCQTFFFYFFFPYWWKLSIAFPLLSLWVCTSVCIILSAVQGAFGKMMFSSFFPVVCGTEREVSESRFTCSFNCLCMFGQVLSFSQVFLYCSEISGIDFMVCGINFPSVSWYCCYRNKAVSLSSPNLQSKLWPCCDQQAQFCVCYCRQVPCQFFILVLWKR